MTTTQMFMACDRVAPFAANNSTDKWAVVVDGLFGLFATRAEAEAVYATLGGDMSMSPDDNLAETPFGSAEIIEPGYFARRNADDIARHTACDIAQYIRLSWSDPTPSLASEMIPASDHSDLLD